MSSTTPVREEQGAGAAHPVAEDDAPEVDRVVALARTESTRWSALTFEQRRGFLESWAALLARRLGELSQVVHIDTGKPESDAQLEAVLAIDHLAWAARHAGRVLGRKRVPSGVLMANHRATVEYQPLGVVGVIGPWNYPVLTPIGSIAHALAAGNTVVFKPSEWAPGVGRWLVDSFADAVPGHADALTLVSGSGPTGAALCRSAVDKIAFTGSESTGRRVMAACAETLTPVLMECGGKDAMIVDADADLGAAADAAVWGGMSNAGQTCIGIERVYVVASVYDEFLGLLVDRASRVEPGVSYGPITMPSQVDVIRDHLEDAVRTGGRVLVGGRIEGRLVEPTVLVDVPEHARAVQEETFGPTLTVHRVADVDEALALVNAGPYGLGGSVFARARGEELARRMRSGMTSINSVLSFAGIPSLPFGGRGASGFGRIHGADGLKEFTTAKAITRQRFALPVAVMSFERTARTDRLVARATRAVHDRRTRRAPHP